MENNNLENNDGQKQDDAAQKMQDTAKGVKDTANLAKNAASGNYLGAAKDALNILKNKEMRKRLIINAIMQILGPLIIIVLAGSLLLGVFNAVGDFIQDAISGIVDFFTIDHEGAISITDERIDAIINGIEEMGISIDGLKLMGDVDYSQPNIKEENQKALRKYIRKFYEAQAMTETLYTKPSWLESVTTSKPYGTVYVNRTKENDTDLKKTERLGYISYNEMKALETKNDKKAKKYYSVDERGKLIIACINTTTITEDGGRGTKKEYVYLKAIDYKTAISQYTTSMNFFLYLAMISQNPEFVSAVVELVKDSEIQITLMDTVTESTTKEEYTYDEHTKTVTAYFDQQKRKTVYATNPTETKSKTKTVETKTTNVEPIVAITHVKTWFCEQDITYNKKPGNLVTSNPQVIDGNSDDSLKDENEPPTPGTAGSVTWRTNQKKTITNSQKVTKYEEGTRGDVVIKTGQKGDAERYKKGEIPQKTFIGLMETKYKIPNSTREAIAGENLVSGAEMLFYLFQKDAKLQNMELIMRDVLNKYTGTERYGKINLNDLLTYLEIRILPVGSDYIVDTRRSDKSIIISDANKLKEAIESIYDGKRKENLVGQAENFMKMQREYNVNAVFAIAVTIIESGGGTNWSAIDESTHNWMSITGSYNGQTYRDPNSSNPRTWRVYPSYKEAIMDFGDLISNGSYYFQNGKYSVKTIAPTYCNDAWGISVSAEMTKIFNAAGIDTSSMYMAQGGITTDTEASQLQSTIENEWINTKVHYRDSAFQGGPFAKYWNYDYNLLSKFQCTWWANGRASMYLEQYGTKYKKYPTQMGNGGEYYRINQENGWFEYGNEPRPNSIISWTHGQYGHVAYVEGVSADGIYISHAGSGTSWFGVQKIPLNGSVWDYGAPNGYIYLDMPR